MLPLVEAATSGRPESLLGEGFAPARTVVTPLIHLQSEATMTAAHVNSVFYFMNGHSEASAKINPVVKVHT